MLAYYALRDIGNDGPDTVTHLLSKIVERRSTFGSIFTVLLSALPTLFIAISRVSRGLLRNLVSYLFYYSYSQIIWDQTGVPLNLIVRHKVATSPITNI
ncbi:MAG: hypothetical protein ACI9WC_002542 [Arenicella sp.]|jgi:hypothetical protein